MTEIIQCNWRSSDRNVHGAMGYPDGPDGARCVIYNFEADVKGQGFGTRAVEELRRKHSHIHVPDCGDETTRSQRFWLKMAERGLVDVLNDFNGKTVWPIPITDTLLAIRDAMNSEGDVMQVSPSLFRALQGNLEDTLRDREQQ